MALRLLWFPTTSSTEQNHQILSLCKPSQKPFPTLVSPFSISSISLSHLSTISNAKRRTDLFILQVSSALEPLSSPPPPPSSPTEELEESRTRLIATNVPWSATADDIKNLFQKYGNVIDVELSMYNKIRNRGLAFVTMGSEEEALQALTELNSYELEGRVINVAYAKARKKKSPVVKVATPTIPSYDVFVANLSWKVKSKDLMAFFASMSDDVVSADVTYQLNPTRKPTGYGFVSFRSKEKAEEAIAAFQGKELMRKPVRLALSNRSLKAESGDTTSVGEPSVEVNTDEGISDNADGINS